jgi:agmatine deiminase
MMSRPHTLPTMLLCSLVVILIGTGSLQSIAVSVSYEIDNPQTLLASPPGPIRNVAEFESMEGVLIRYPFGITYNVIAEMSENVTVYTIVASSSEQSSVLSQYQSHGVNTANCEFLIAASDSYWTRDYGPWFIFNGIDELGVIDFNYNRNRPNDNQIPSKFAIYKGFPSYYMPLTHTGGNYMTDSEGISISTDLVLSENPGLTQSQINQIMSDYLGITTYHTVPDALGDYIAHIDCWAKLLSPDTIMIIQSSPAHPHYEDFEEAAQYFENQTTCYGTTYHVVRVYTNMNEPYINSLILNNKVFVPITGSQWDDDALDAYETAMPGYEVLGFTGSWQSTDALHCRAKGIPDPEMLYIKHTPLSGIINGDEGVTIAFDSIAFSGYDIDTSASMVYWKENSGTWQTSTIQATGGDSYQAILTPQQNNSLISYYIHMEDTSGKTANHPYIGAPDPHQFTVDIIDINVPPEQPEQPSGEISGNVETTYTYSTMTTDVDGDQVYYLWDWGDGNFSEWLGPFASGATATAQKSWAVKGTYSIRVKAKDVFGNESTWSEPLSVTMPKDKALLFSFFEKLEQRFPNISLLIHEFFYRFG